ADENGEPSEKRTSRRRRKVIFDPPSEIFQLKAMLGSSSCVYRLMRIRTPPVRYRTVSDASSSTSSAWNVFGSERRQKRNEPPNWAEACAAAMRITAARVSARFM